jgi:SAM-dependent methyltransferase
LTCGFAFVADPWTDYDAIYDSAYYAGRGADPLVDYAFEWSQPERTVRFYEWRGISRVVAELVQLGSDTRWLDFGCGTGGLVRYLRDTTGCTAVGYERGWAADRLSVPHLDDDGLQDAAGTFDVVTAVEVIEHAIEPMELLLQFRRLLRPGGLLLLTTGNAESYRDHLARWRYVVPEIHVSFFEPGTLALALEKARFRPQRPGLLPGHVDILRFKILKNLGIRRRSYFEAVLPWPLLARAVNIKVRATAHPIGFADDTPENAS